MKREWLQRFRREQRKLARVRRAAWRLKQAEWERVMGDQLTHRVVGIRAALGSKRPAEALVIKAGDPVVPVPIGPYQEGDRVDGAAWQVLGPMAGIGHIRVIRHAAVIEERAGPVTCCRTAALGSL
ncbi:hypothetical protein [Streptomyces atratus]|uniref:hypothetical protein n=1 Tax=Streptomyces atratus TaxID=1893 RepID=UPI00364D4DC3